VIAALGIIWIGVTRLNPDEVNSTGRPPAPELGHPAPDFTLLTADGTAISLSDFRGQPVLINFWATWCPPCRAEIPALESAWRDLEGQAVVLGVDVQESAETVTDFMSDNEMTYPVLLDGTADVARMYRVRAFPTSYLIDAHGVVVEIYSGPVSEPLVRARLAGLLGE
jgi:peroxiredoxin